MTLRGTLNGYLKSIDRYLTVRLTYRTLRLGVRLTRQNPAFLGLMACRWLNRLYHRRGYTSDFNEAGFDVFEADWDNLLILDACRLDMLDGEDFDGEAETVESRGSDTYEFLRANCGGRDLSDTVYVSASPMLYWRSETIDHNFHDVIYVWEEDGWDEANRTVLPETVTEYALEAAAEYPNKRLLVHYLQPHYPFVDSGTDFDKRQLHDPNETHPSFWRMVETDQIDISTDRIWELYRANLQRALPHARELVESLDGKTVVTSDHGNMVGERSYPIPITEWGHPAGTYTPELVKVPWIECPHDERRRIVAGERTETTTEADRDVAEERMTALGYLT